MQGCLRFLSLPGLGRAFGESLQYLLRPRRSGHLEDLDCPQGSKTVSGRVYGLTVLFIDQLFEASADLCGSVRLHGLAQSTSGRFTYVFQFLLGVFPHRELIAVQVGDQPCQALFVGDRDSLDVFPQIGNGFGGGCSQLAQCLEGASGIIAA